MGDMIPGPVRAHTGEMLFTHMLALYTNSGTIRLHTKTHNRRRCVHERKVYAPTNSHIVGHE